MKIAELLEVFPGRHALVLLEGVVPCLGRTPEMVGGKPGTVRRQGVLAPEKLVALVEPI
jgi:hypothetical protein